MTFTFVPAHTVSYPDRFEDEQNDMSYEVFQDMYAEDPRSWMNPEHAAIFVYNEYRQLTAPTPPDNIAAKAFQRFYERFSSDTSLELTRRYLSVFHPETPYQTEIATIRGYSQSDWADVFVAIADGYGTPQDHIDEFRRWSYGDVWVVSPDNGPAVGGIYADSPEEALAQFLENSSDSINELSAKNETPQASLST